MYSLLADLVVLLHFGFILFVIAGGLLALRWPRAAWLHLPTVAWGAGIELVGGICPLTPLEVRLRILDGGTLQEGDFIARFLLPLIYPENLTREIQVLLGLAVIVVNLAIYAWVLSRQRGRR